MFRVIVAKHQNLKLSPNSAISKSYKKRKKYQQLKFNNELSINVNQVGGKVGG